MLKFIGKRLLQLIPTLFFVSVLIFSLQHLLPGDPALVMAGEENDPAVVEQIRQQYHLDQPIPLAICLLGQGHPVGRSRRVDADQGAGAQLDSGKAAGHRATCLHGDHHRADDRHLGRHYFGGEKEHRLGLRRQRVRAMGNFHAEFLAWHHADLSFFREARLAAGVGLCAACAKTGARVSPPPSCRPLCSATPSPRS